MVAIIFFAIVIGYGALILIDPQIGGGDDMAFLRTLQKGEFLLHYRVGFAHTDTISSKEQGRFMPLQAMEYNLVSLVSNTPFAYYLFNTIQFWIFVLILLKLLERFTPRKLLSYAAIILFILTPGFSEAWISVLVTERNVVFYLAAFLLSYLLYNQNKKARYLILGFMSANLAIYYKETTAIALLVFVFSHIIATRKESAKKINDLDGAVILSVVAYFISYFTLILPFSSLPLYADQIGGSLVGNIKNIFNFSLSDPLIILIILPLTAWRLYRIFIKRERIMPIIDPMLAAAALYPAIYLVLGGYNTYYLMPSYIFALPPLLYFLDKREPLRFLRYAGLFVVVILLAGTIPASIHHSTKQKYWHTNLHKTLDFFVNDIKSNQAGKRANIFLDQVKRGNSIYLLWAEHLMNKGLEPADFDLRAMSEDEIIPPAFQLIDQPFTVFKTSGTSSISQGDYLLVYAFNLGTRTDKAYLDSLLEDYKLVFRTESPFAFPNVNIKTLVKKISLIILPENYIDKLIVTKSTEYTPDYYVFVRR